MDAETRHQFDLLRQEFRNEAKETRTALNRIEAHMAKRDKVLFGDDGTGGLVAKALEMETKWKVLGAIAVLAFGAAATALATILVS